MFEKFQEQFGSMFGKLQPDMCKLTMNGNIAVKCSNGYKTYNVKKGTLTNVTNFCFNVDEMFFIIRVCFFAILESTVTRKHHQKLESNTRLT